MELQIYDGRLAKLSEDEDSQSEDISTEHGDVTEDDRCIFLRPGRLKFAKNWATSFETCRVDRRNGAFPLFEEAAVLRMHIRIETINIARSPEYMSRELWPAKIALFHLQTRSLKRLPGEVISSDCLKRRMPSRRGQNLHQNKNSIEHWSEAPSH